MFRTGDICASIYLPLVIYEPNICFTPKSYNYFKDLHEGKNGTSTNHIRANGLTRSINQTGDNSRKNSNNSETAQPLWSSNSQKEFNARTIQRAKDCG